MNDTKKKVFHTSNPSAEPIERTKTLATSVKSAKPANSKSSKDQETSKVSTVPAKIAKENFKHYFHTAEVALHKNGDITVTITEKHLESLNLVIGEVYELTLEADKIFSYITSTCLPNRFFAVVYAGRITRRKYHARDIIDELANEPVKDYNYFRKNIYLFGFYTAIESALKSSISYDSPYGSGKSPYSIPSYVGVSGSKPQLIVA